MTDTLHDLGHGFFNIRGSFRIAGLFNIGTHCSLVELNPGRFIFLDSYSLQGAVREQVMAMTHDGKDVEAVLNLHPFHTVHCAQMARDFPAARFYGSSRHHQKVPEVQWAPELVESDAVVACYPQLEFALPEGIDYISANEHVHASSLLAYHRLSRSLHVDDTIGVAPGWLKPLLPRQRHVLLHPTLRKALKPEADAGRRFCDWMDALAERWQATKHLCAAHSGIEHCAQGEFAPLLRQAVARVRPKLERHR